MLAGVRRVSAVELANGVGIDFRDALFLINPMPDLTLDSDRRAPRSSDRIQSRF